MVFGIYKTPESVEQSWGDLKTGDIPDSIEFEYTRYFCGVGTFALTVPRTTLYADKIEVGSILILHEKEGEYSGFIVKNIKQLISTEKLASTMEKMLEEQREQGKRISKLEGRDGEKWRSVAKIVATAVISAAIGALLMMIGIK